MSLFRIKMVVYIEIPQKPIDKILKLIREFGKITG